MTDGSAIEHVSDTAYLVAHCRAIESARTDALFRDPLAGRLAGERGKAITDAFPTAKMTGWLVSIRTCIIDEFVRAAIGRGVDTIVNLGAGLDTRPYRLEVPSHLHWLEVDYPHVIAYKEERLQQETPRCRLERVGLDLGDVTARRQWLARFDSQAKRTLFLTEGVIPYLDVAEVGSLADDLRSQSHLDAWIVDYLSKEGHKYRERAGVTRHLRQAPFKFRPDDWFAFFSDHGFRVREIRYVPQEGARLGRRAPLPLRHRLLISIFRRLGSAHVRHQLERYSGYAVLEPTSAASP